MFKESAELVAERIALHTGFHKDDIHVESYEELVNKKITHFNIWTPFGNKHYSLTIDEHEQRSYLLDRESEIYAKTE